MTLDRMRRIERIHFVGLGGAGMSGIAEVLLNLGYQVQGSDLRESANTARLRSLGATVQIGGHQAEHIGGANVVVVSSAVSDDNVEVLAAQAARVPVVPRAEMLAELMRFRHGIAVAGTHGKTTTTSLIASVLAEGQLDPTFVIGGRLNSSGTHARLGGGRYLVAEADESDGSFLMLQPMISVITNIDNDHLDTYGGDMSRVHGAFRDFAHNLPFYGLVVACADDPGVRAVLGELNRPLLTYGLGEDVDLRASDLEADGMVSRFQVHSAAGSAAFEVALPGLHNVRNALAAIAVGRELGCDDEAIRRALGSFAGIGRRFQRRGEVRTQAGRVELVDDYGHHPTEVEATLQAARSVFPDRRLVACFQPHRYTRTRDLMDDFARVLSSTDVLLVLEVYAAGESPIPGADGRAIARAVRQRGRVEPVFVERVEDLPSTLLGVVQDGDVVLTLGAGTVGAVAEDLVQQLASGEGA
ncbi:MAG: UDP-N-acetylmuramate--L-alanine ligase [Pseudomonadota bacterium]